MEENKEQPFVTVFTPVYNPPIKNFRKCIESVINQTYTNFEWVLLDDASDNGCFEAVSDLIESDERIKVYHLEHNYIATLNYGLSIAKGKYILKHDSDDEMYPTRIEDQVTVMESDPEIVICMGGLDTYGTTYNYGTKGKIDALNVLEDIKNNRFGTFSGSNYCFRTDFIENNEIEYDPDFTYVDDRKILLDIAAAGGAVYRLDKNLILYNLNNSSMSTNSQIGEDLQKFNDYVASHINDLILNYKLKKYEEEINSYPLVTVLTPVYNPPIDTFRKCIESVLNQTYINFELLLLDNGSDNGCFEAVSDLIESDKRIKVYHLEYNYIATLNYGLSIAKGKYIINHSSDNEMFSNRIDKQISIMEDDSDIAICICNFNDVDNRFHCAGSKGKIQPQEYIKALAADTHMINETPFGCSFAYRTDFIHSHNILFKIKEHLPLLGHLDRAYIFDIVSAGGYVYSMDDILLNYRYINRMSSDQNCGRNFNAYVEKYKEITDSPK